MSNYTNTFGGAAKDAATDIILGVDFDTEFDALATMSGTKATLLSAATVDNVLTMTAGGDLKDSSTQLAALALLAGPTFTGTVTADVMTVTGAFTGSGGIDGVIGAVTAAALTATTIAGTTGTFSGEVTGTGFTGTLDGILGGGTPAAVTATTGTFSGEVTGTGFTGTLDGVLGGGSAAAASVTTLGASGAATLAALSATTGTFSGIVSVDSTQESSSTTTGSIHTDGGLGVAKKAFFGTSVDVAGSLNVEAYSEDADQYTATTGTRTLNTAIATYFYPSADLGTATITFAFSNPASSGRVTSFTMELLGADGATLTWPASVDWPSTGEPTWSSGVDVVSFITRDGGTTWLAFVGGQGMA